MFETGELASLKCCSACLWPGYNHLFFVLWLGIIGGLTSVITSTVEGVKTEGGVSGFISGFGKGLVGTVTKPVAGALDFASETAQAVRDTATLSGPRSVVPGEWIRDFRPRSAASRTPPCCV